MPLVRVKSVWAKRVGVGVAVLVAAGGGYVGLNWKAIHTRLTASRFRAAPTDEARAALAAELLAAGEPGVGRLVDTLRTGPPEQCQAVASVLAQHLRDLPPSDPRYAAVARPLLAAGDSFGGAGKEAALDLVPHLLRWDDPDAAERCKGLVKGGLAGASPEAKVRAVRLAAAPQLGLRAELVPLLNDPAAAVRRAAIAAVGPGGENPVVDTEELFRWLNDPDDEVRLLCEAALGTRGLEPEQIDAGRKLTHPEASERLTLLVDLQRGRGGALRDPGPWLERLSRDPDPAVRAGAARVACESRLAFVGWLDQLTADPDPTVRQIAGFHRQRAEQLRQVGFDRE
jgi:hypothetical protein